MVKYQLWSITYKGHGKENIPQESTFARIRRTWSISSVTEMEECAENRRQASLRSLPNSDDEMYELGDDDIMDELVGDDCDDIEEGTKVVEDRVDAEATEGDVELGIVSLEKPITDDETVVELCDVP